MYAKVSHRGLRFFQHAPGAPTCTLALESIAHHLLKLELANAARAAGVDAEMEVRGPDGTWRADVMASDPGGAWRVALEAQLAPITAGDITARTERMRVDGVPSIWFSDRPKPPWLGVVPSVRLAQADDSEHLVIAAGLVKFDGYWQAVPASLADFLRWAFTGRIVTYSPVGCVLEGFATVWTAPRYVQASDEYQAAKERQAEQARRAVAARQERKQEETQQKNAISRAEAHSEAAAAEKAAHGTGRSETWWHYRERATRRRVVAEAIALLACKYNVTATVGWSVGDARYADGIPLVGVDGALVAVFSPDARRVRGKAFLLLAGTLLLFPSRQAQRLFEEKVKHKPMDGWRTDVVLPG